jgi:hypothetical protein
MLLNDFPAESIRGEPPAKNESALIMQTLTAAGETKPPRRPTEVQAGVTKTLQ